MPPSGLERCFDLDDLARLARRRMPAPMWHYLAGAADDERTLGRNTTAFADFDLVPRYLVDVAAIDTSVTVLGQRLELPIMIAPTGMSRLFHADGERAVARAARRAGTMYSLSTLGTTSIEDVAAVNDGPKCFQIYVMRERELTAELMDRCRAAGYSALCLTIDVPVAGNRERDLRTGMTLPPRLRLMSLADIALHPRWCLDYLTRPPLTLANVAHRIAEGTRTVSSVIQYIGSQFDPSVTWRDAAWMIQRWSGPFAIKGILSVDDARRAVEIGASAIVVSNHGGRQLDGAPAPFDALEAIVDAVGDRVEVILDGGIRRGTHVLKALALGARACMIGRGYLYGLGAGGEAGVDRALAILRQEIERDLRLVGCPRAADLDRRFLRHAGVGPPA
ncbi:MAG: alpha-hydroxy acid oxidase [Gammaproteobacteria bacterium]